MHKFVHCSVSSDGAVRYYAAVDGSGAVWGWNDKTPDQPWKELGPPKPVEEVKEKATWVGAEKPVPADETPAVTHSSSRHSSR